MRRPEADDGTISGLPWASVFDPAANLRALEDVRARGVRAAAEVIERLVRAVDGASDPEDEATVDPERDRASGTGPVAGSWTDVVDRLAGGSAGLDLAGDDRARTLRIGSVATGPATGTLWLHNTTDDELAIARLRSTSLVGHDGDAVGADAVRFEPSAPRLLPPRSSAAVQVVIDLPTDLVAPTTLRGVVVADGHDDVWLPIAVTVTELR